MSKFNDFDLILAEFNKTAERFFLSDIRDFAQENQEVVIKTYGLLLKNKKLNIQLKYLVLKSIGQLKYSEFIPVVKDQLYREDKVRIIIEAVNSLIAMNNLPAFKVVVDFLLKNKNAEYREVLEKNLRTVFSKNQLLYHFDIFYRKRGDVNGIEKSSEYLIEHLPEDYIKDLLPALSSKYYTIRLELLRILKHRPNPIYYSNIYLYFKENIRSMDEELFLALSEALTINASLSKARIRIYQQLKEHVPKLSGNRKILFCIALLKLNTRELIHFISGVYPKLNFDLKMLVLNNFKPEDYIDYMEFVRELVVLEHNETLLDRIIEILVKANDFRYLFEILDAEAGVRKSKILNMILEHVDREPGEIDEYIHKYVTPTQDNAILHLALGFLLKHMADKYYQLIKSIFFSGASYDAKILIIRNVNKFSGYSQKEFMETVFQDLTVIRPFKKDFLFSLLGVLNEKLFDQELEEKILNRILVMMEEAHFDEIVNFIYFFDRYEINNERDSQLIIDELRLIQNTLLKSPDENNMVKMIHGLTRQIEKKMVLKK
ncbi:MAG: hypothetical protein GY940_28285 [bacterium]|nr:hypothetical protein [bacterium]